MSWSEHRKRVHRSATAKWNERSYEMRKIRRNLSAKARQLNAAANANRKHTMLDIAEADQVAAIHDNEITTHQLRLLKTTIDSGGIAADHDFMQPPAGYRPIALAEYAGRQYPFSEQPAIADQPPDNVVVVAVDEEKSGDTVADSIEYLNIYGQGLYGLADSEFGVSEALLQEASNMVGFVSKSDTEFESSYSQVCNAEPAFNLKAGDDLDSMRSCQHLCGRYCRKDITDSKQFFNCVEMLRTIVRIVASKRDVKVGKTLHIGPSCKLPLLVVATPHGIWARLAYRFVFNPLEIDWIHCEIDSIEKADGTHYYVTLDFQPLGATNRLCPKSDTMCELAIWLSSTFTGGDGFKIHLFFEYDLHETHDHILIPRPCHQPSTIDAIVANSFQSLVDGGKHAKDLGFGDDAAAKSLGMLVSVLNKGTQTKTKTTKGEGQSTAKGLSKMLHELGEKPGKQSSSGKSKSSSNSSGRTSASSAADVLLAQLDGVPRSHHPQAVIDDDHDEPDELEVDWNDAINARYGFDEGPEASSSSKQGNKRKRSSSKPSGSRNAESPGDMRPLDSNAPQRCFVDPSNQRVIAEFADGTRRALGRITEFKIGEPGHSMSVACYLHTKCSVVRLISRLPYGACTLCMNYLEAGLRVKDRNDSAAHKRMFDSLVSSDGTDTS